MFTIYSFVSVSGHRPPRAFGTDVEGIILNHWTHILFTCAVPSSVPKDAGLVVVIPNAGHLLITQSHAECLIRITLAEYRIDPLGQLEEPIKSGQVRYN